MAIEETMVEPPAPECFVVMPITDPDGYEAGHFQHVFDDIIGPACTMAGYRSVRADQIRETNLIHLDVLQRLVESPMVLVDLSSRNPNVLFELGLRQAFDKPAVLVQETSTPKIFDIAPLRFTEYRRARVYHEVLEDQRKIAEALRATKEAFDRGVGVNSIVRILSLTKPAALVEVQETQRDPAFQIIRAEIGELRDELRRSQVRSPRHEPAHLLDELESVYSEVNFLEMRLADATMRADAAALDSLGSERNRVNELLARSRGRKSPVWQDLFRRLRRVEQALSLLVAQTPSQNDSNAG